MSELWYRDNLGIYVHIPFCIKKCNYCDFNSYEGMDDIFDAYIDAIFAEMQKIKLQVNDRRVDSIFIGGGTPSILPLGMISKIIKGLLENFVIERHTEITIEVNPCTLTIDKIKEYADAGINRLSLGLQAWQDEMLAFLGRQHTLQRFLNAYEDGVKNGFNNINVDLIFGIPGQTLHQWKQTIENVVLLKPKHVSCYSLSIEEGTKLSQMIKDNKNEIINDDEERKMYWQAVDILNKNGYSHYEISNFCFSGFQCRHNLKYWNANEYIGLGAGAHSYLNRKRYSNIKNVFEYIHNANKDDSYIIEEQLDDFCALKEHIMLNFRLIEGVDIKKIESIYKVDLFDIFEDKISKLINSGLIYKKDNSLRLTKKGIDYANQVFMEFL